MDPHIAFRIVPVVFLFILSGVFSGSEASLFSLTPLHLHKMKEERARFLSSIRSLLDHPRRLLITVLVGNESVNVAISVVAAGVFIWVFGEEGTWMTIAIMTPLILIFGEAIPKNLAIINPIRFSSFVSPVLLSFSRTVQPVVWALEKISGWIITFLRIAPPPQSGFLEEEFKTLIDAGHRQGALEESQKVLIGKALELDKVMVSEVMTPRVDVFCLPVSMGIGEMVAEIVKNARHSRIPVYGDNSDDILGILYTKDLLAMMARGEKITRIETLLRKPYFVPLYKRARSLLGDFQARRIHLAIVVDEYGGVAGVVTLEDILECLFGEIYDENDIKRDIYRRIDEKTFIVWGMMPKKILNETLGAPVIQGDFDTVGGFVFHLFGRLPVSGEEASAGGCIFRVEKVSGTRIEEIRVTKSETENGK